MSEELGSQQSRQHAEQTETALRRSEERLRLFLDTSFNSFITIDEAGLITDWNHQAETTFGWSRAEVMGRSLAEMIIPPAYRERHLQGIQRFLATGEGPVLNKRIELTALRRDGSEFPIELSIVPLRWEGAYLFSALVHDITARKRAEATKQQAEEQAVLNERRLNLVLDSAQMGAWDLDLVTDRAWRSIQHDQIFGYDSLQPAWGFETFLTHVVPEDREQVKASLSEARATGYFHMECRIVWPDQSRHWIASEGRVHANDKGEPVHMSGVVMNIDERKQLEQALAEQAEGLARSNRELEMFASVASHDLQEPLRMVSSYVELLAKRYEGKLDDKANRWIHFAMDGAMRMKQLINDLLEFSRVGTHGKPLEPTDCGVVFQKVVANLQKAIVENRATVTRGPLPVVNADVTQLTQVFQNLIGNALKFHGPVPPVVRVEAQRQGRNWLFSVQDNGIGIDPQYAHRIFVIFQRLHSREEYAGTGIGLALCKKVIERHGGHIWVESQPGEGATFYFTLPAAGGDQHAAAPSV
jgi:PAS domain S-box-containing protein